MKKPVIDWDVIETVLLDMDGTLIDQHHEDVFWDNILPRAYAKKHKITFKKAIDELYVLYRAKEGHKDWGNVNAWGKQLDMDLVALRKKIKPYVKLHPHTKRFLNFIQSKHKRTYLVTAAMKFDVDFEITHTKIGHYFDDFIYATEMKMSKDDPNFWKRIQKKFKFNPKRTIVLDDREKMLLAAEKSGIKFLVFKSKSSSRKPPSLPKEIKSAICVHHFDELIPSSRKSL